MFVHMEPSLRVPFSACFIYFLNQIIPLLTLFSATLGERHFLCWQRGQPSHVGPREVQIARVRRGHGQ